ncbi:MAG TPA: FAD-dependent oxidoreductase [Candidatus Hydrogenedentes bacterium]|nr:FAD-dependent oxidoreductase [Candidatus Hydrogenedentota bacterium]
MEERAYDAAVIGAGAAGMAAALRIAAAGCRVALIDREDHLGGILLQCIHNGFGLHRFNEELTGPEFAERFSGQLVDSDRIDVLLNTTVLEMQSEGPTKSLLVCGPDCGVLKLTARAVVLAMGCRERNRGNLGIPGTRPAGIFTAGLAQRLVNIEGYIPGKRVVIVGSGDIGLIMARRMRWVGAEVLAVVEILPHPSGITRNIVQCLNDFNIPLYLSHIVSRIVGRDRVEAVEITPLEAGRPDPDKTFRLDCDTILLSVGLIPENELSKAAGVQLDADTGGPRVDARLMTSIDGVFACGNVLHVHDLVDWASAEATRCGDYVVAYLRDGVSARPQGRVLPGANVKYVVPHRYLPDAENQFSLRALIVKDIGTITVKRDGKLVKRRTLRHIRPAEMIHVKVRPADVPVVEGADPEPLEIAIE